MTGTGPRDGRIETIAGGHPGDDQRGATAPTRTIGQSARRVGGLERVTGGYRYLADMPLEGVQHVKLVHLDCARARIVSIDTRDAERVPGVRIVATADDLPQPVARFGPGYADRPLLAVGETKYHGEPVAVVVAETLDAAREAAAAVRVEYEELPAVVSIGQALDRASPLVRDPDLRAPDDPCRETNTLTEWSFGWGDVDAARADHVIENRYTTAATTHCEP